MANTANQTIDSTLTTDFSVAPYYDDYNKTKGYYRILYRPGFAVQARELTQMQTLLQTQIARFGKHVFKEGSIVLPGAFTLRTNVRDEKRDPIDYVKIKDTDVANTVVDVNDLKYQVMRGLTSNVYGYIIDVLDKEEGSTSNTKTLYLKYISASPANSQIRTYLAGETLATNNSTYTAIVKNDDPVANTGYASWFKIDEGVFFAKDHFIWFPEQSVVLDRYNPNPTCKVGFYVSENIIKYTNDTSLLDPALESSNFSAPGADRLQLVSKLSVLPLDYNVPSDFVTLFTLKDGVLQLKNDEPDYNVLGDALASRTSDESGDYVVRGMNVQISEHDAVTNPIPNYGKYANGNNQLLVVSVDPGLAYVKGYKVQTWDIINLDLLKPVANIRNVTDQITSTSVGQYFRVNELVGSWEENKSNRIQFYDVVNRRVTNDGSTTGGKWSTGAVTGNNIGSGIITSLQYVSGIPGYNALYDVFVSDIQMLGSNNISSIKSLYYDNSTAADFGADIFNATSTSANLTSLREVNKSPLLYFVGSNYVKSVRDKDGNPSTDYSITKTEGISSIISFNTGGTLTLSPTLPSGESLPYSTGSTLSSTDILQDLVVTCGQSLNIGPLFSAAVVAATGNSITGLGTNFTRFNVGDKVEFSGNTDTFYITSIANDTNMFVSANTFAITANTIFKAYKAGDILDFTGKGITSGTARTVTIPSTGTFLFDLKETLPSTISATVNFKSAISNATEAGKDLKPNRLVKINCSTAGTTGPFCLGFSDVYKIRKVIRKGGSSYPTTLTDGDDVTKYFILDTGQRDHKYELASIVKTTGLSLSSSDRLLVELDYFNPIYSGKASYFSVNSYNIQDDDTLSSNTTLRTESVPVYFSPTDGQGYDLRNYLDFRPVKTSTASDVTVIGSASENPSNNSTSYVYTNYMKFPIPSGEVRFDYVYYLGRKDLIVVNKDTQFSIKYGEASENPITPEPDPKTMLVSILSIAPYPSLSPAYANALRRRDLSCFAKKASNRRYTMRDIGVLDSRIKNLEYYTSLTLLEKEAVNLKILDENGLDRFKNGIFIDTFRDTSLSASGIDKDYRIAIDPIELSIRPLFTTESMSYDYLSGDSKIKKHDNGIVTIDYDEVVLFDQPSATDVRNLERGTFLFEGTMALYPKDDVWIDTSFAPDEVVKLDAKGALLDISVNGQGQDAEIKTALVNTVWQSWKTQITGYSLYRNQGSSRTFVGNFATEAEAVQASKAWTGAKGGGTATIVTNYFNDRVGTNYFSNQSTDTAVGGYKLVSSEVINYIRPQRIVVEVNGLKPYSKMNAFFDDVNVSNLCTPLTQAQFAKAIAKQTQTGLAVEGSDLIVGTDGSLYFSIRLPVDSPKFRCGERRIAVIDGEQLAPTSFLSEQDASTFASQIFFANGSKQTLQRTVYSTSGYLVTTESLYQSKKTQSEKTLPNTYVPPPKCKHCCFNPEAKVLMSDLSWKQIKDIVPGDLVMGEGGTVNKVQTLNVIEVGDRKMMKFKGHDFYTTDDHLFYTKKGYKTWDPQYVVKNPNTSNRRFLVGDNKFEPIGLEDEIKIYSIENNKLSDKFVKYSEIKAIAHTFDPEYKVYDLNLDGNNTYIVEGFIVHNCCAAYTVLIKAPQEEEGVFVTSFDVFVGRKSSTRGLWFEIREVDDAGNITNTQIPHSEVHIDNASIVESPNGKDNPLNVKFDCPIFLFNEKMYAFVVHSVSPNSLSVDPDTQIWISRLTERDQNTGEQINDRMGAGRFYQTTNNKQWDYIPDLDLTMKLYRADFDTGTYQFQIGNKPVEKMFLANLSLSLTSKVGDFFSGANGSAMLTYIDEDVSNVYSKWEFSNGKFEIGKTINCSSYGGNSYNATVESFGTFRYSSVSLEPAALDFIKTNIGYNMSTIANGTTTLGNYENLVPSETYYFPEEKVVYGRTTEVNSLSGSRSNRVQVIFSSVSNYVSPVFDLNNSHTIFIDNLINANTVGEDGKAGGSTLNKYISQITTLAEGQDAEDLKIYLTAYRPPNTDVEVYVKLLHAEDSETMAQKNWIKLNREADGDSTYSSISDRNNFREFVYNIPSSYLTGGEYGSFQYTSGTGITFTGYKYFAVKILLLASNSAVVPRVADLRAIALQL